MVLVCTWSMKRRLWSGVYWIWNVPVLWKVEWLTKTLCQEARDVLCDRVGSIDRW